MLSSLLALAVLFGDALPEMDTRTISRGLGFENANWPLRSNDVRNSTTSSHEGSHEGSHAMLLNFHVEMDIDSKSLLCVDSLFHGLGRNVSHRHL